VTNESVKGYTPPSSAGPSSRFDNGLQAEINKSVLTAKNFRVSFLVLIWEKTQLRITKTPLNNGDIVAPNN